MFWYTNIYEMNIGISHISIIISSVCLFSWLLMYEGIYTVILIAPYEHIKNIRLILTSTSWILVLVILIPIVDLIIRGVREWISFDLYYNRVWLGLFMRVEVSDCIFDISIVFIEWYWWWIDYLYCILTLVFFPIKFIWIHL